MYRLLVRQSFDGKLTLLKEGTLEECELYRDGYVRSVQHYTNHRVEVLPTGDVTITAGYLPSWITVWTISLQEVKIAPF